MMGEEIVMQIFAATAAAPMRREKSHV